MDKRKFYQTIYQLPDFTRNFMDVDILHTYIREGRYTRNEYACCILITFASWIVDDSFARYFHITMEEILMSGELSLRAKFVRNVQEVIFSYPFY